MASVILFAAFSLLGLVTCLGLQGTQELEVSAGLRKDAAALRIFKEGIESDPSGALRDWGIQPNPCHWYGVECARVLSEMSASADGLETRVVRIELWGLELRGSISAEIGRISELRELAIVGTKITGPIPIQIYNCQRLSTLDLRLNDLYGDIDISLANLPNLQVLKLSENSITGTLSGLFAERKTYKDFDPFRFPGYRRSSKRGRKGSCRSLRILDLAKNSISGEISPAVEGCTRLSEVRLNGNRLNGRIPSNLSNIPHLRALFLNDNSLSGELPASLAGCKNLLYLNVADNILSGSIPTVFAALVAGRKFNFSNNRLKGPIPLGKWRVEQMALDGIFSGNTGLCGWPLRQLCGSLSRQIDTHVSSHAPANLFTKTVKTLAILNQSLEAWIQQTAPLHSKGRMTVSQTFGSRRRFLVEGASPKQNHAARRWVVGLALGILAGALAAILMATILRLCVFYMHKAPYLHGPIIFHPNISPKMLMFLEKDEALNDADLVGQGGAGRVYKVHLENEKAVAVKTVEVREDQKGIFGEKQIQSELETLGCIRHRNLVSLLAYVHRPNCHLLLYEYMQNGSLSHALQRVSAGDVELPWPVRHRIAVGTAQGLSYLHFLSKPKIVHRDLKPSNILLDDNFKAHVSDFGLAKVIPGADTHVSTGFAGTVGYIAPEYSQTCRFTEMCDVYSFGVVLAVVLTGKDPTDQFFHTVPGGNIGSWLHDLMQKGDVRVAIDPNLRTDDTAVEEQILLAMKIAVFCTLGNPNERPTSKEALIMLKQIRNDEDY